MLSQRIFVIDDLSLCIVLLPLFFPCSVSLFLVYRLRKFKFDDDEGALSLVWTKLMNFDGFVLKESSDAAVYEVVLLFFYKLSFFRCSIGFDIPRGERKKR